MCAASGGRTGIVEVLLKAGANLWLTNKVRNMLFRRCKGIDVSVDIVCLLDGWYIVPVWIASVRTPPLFLCFLHFSLECIESAQSVSVILSSVSYGYVSWWCTSYHIVAACLSVNGWSVLSPSERVILPSLYSPFCGTNGFSYFIYSAWWIKGSDGSWLRQGRL